LKLNKAGTDSVFMAWQSPSCLCRSTGRAAGEKHAA